MYRGSTCNFDRSSRREYGVLVLFGMKDCEWGSGTGLPGSSTVIIPSFQLAVAILKFAVEDFTDLARCILPYLMETSNVFNLAACSTMPPCKRRFMAMLLSLVMQCWTVLFIAVLIGCFR